MPQRVRGEAAKARRSSSVAPRRADSGSSAAPAEAAAHSAKIRRPARGAERRIVTG